MFRLILPKLGCIALLLLPASRTWSAEKTAAELVPSSSIAYVEMSHPKDFIRFVLNHPLRKQLEQTDGFRQAMNNPQFKQFQAVIDLLEQRSGTSWQDALENFSDGGISLALDARTQGVVLLLKPRDQKAAESVRDAIFSLARDDAKNKGNPDPIQDINYRGLRAQKAGDSIVCQLGNWMMLSNKIELARATADQFLDNGRGLSQDQEFQQARRIGGGEETPPTVWAFLRVAPLRMFAGDQPLLNAKAKSDNPVIEFLAGGLLSVLQHTPYLTGSLWLDERGIRVSLASPNDPSWVPPQRKFFFADSGGGAPKPLLPPDSLLNISIYRDVPAMWESAPDLFTEPVAAQLAQADSGLSTVFGGRNFGQEVLGAIEPQIQFVAVRQDYSDSARKPKLRLPAGALVLRIKPDKFDAVRRHFRVGFQSLVAFANLDASSKGRPLLETHSEKHGDADILYATFDSSDAPTKSKESSDSDKSSVAPSDDVYLNFSPALVMSNRTMMLCSTHKLAEQLADLEAKPDAEQAIAQNTLVWIKAPPLAQLIEDNRETLIAKNMLEKGHTREQAQKEIELLHALVNYFDDERIRLTPTDKSIRLDFDLLTKPQN